MKPAPTENVRNAAASKSHKRVEESGIRSDMTKSCPTRQVTARPALLHQPGTARQERRLLRYTNDLCRRRKRHRDHRRQRRSGLRKSATVALSPREWHADATKGRTP